MFPERRQITSETFAYISENRTVRLDALYQHIMAYFEMTDEEIAYYVDNFRPYDKAGAYGIQEWIGYVAIERIEGSFYNVMGLPVQKLYTELNDFTELQ